MGANAPTPQRLHQSQQDNCQNGGYVDFDSHANLNIYHKIKPQIVKLHDLKGCGKTLPSNGLTAVKGDRPYPCRASLRSWQGRAQVCLTGKSARSRVTCLPPPRGTRTERAVIGGADNTDYRLKKVNESRGSLPPCGCQELVNNNQQSPND